MKSKSINEGFINLIRTTAIVYSRLPIKPFHGFLGRLYQKYRAKDRQRIAIAKVDGITYELDLRELIDSSIYYVGCFELSTTAVIDRYVKSGMTALDIGANVGCHTLRLAKLVGNNGKVIAFEPMSWALLKLKRNIALNSFHNIIVEKIALSDTSSKQSAFFRTSWPLGAIQLNRGVKEEIDFVTLDDYIRVNRIDRIDFIKLDVDGYEYKVIRGGVDTIGKFRPVMIIELGKYTLKSFGDSLENLIDLLASLGYSFYSEKNFKQYKSKESLLQAVPEDATINVICKSQERR